MSAPIGPGDFVECVDANPNTSPHPRAYRTGELCVVEEVGVDDVGPWLNCVGKVRPVDYGAPEQPGFDICWFRLIYRPKADLIENLKAPLPELVAADLATKELEPATALAGRAASRPPEPSSAKPIERAWSWDHA